MSETPEQKKINDFLEQIKEEQKTIIMNLFREYFNFDRPTDLANKLFETKNKKKKNEFVEEIKVRWSNLKDEIKKMLEDEKEIEKSKKILDIVEETI